MSVYTEAMFSSLECGVVFMAKMKFTWEAFVTCVQSNPSVVF